MTPSKHICGANAARWPGQPPESRATVEEDGDTLIVSLPPVGLVRACGRGFFAFVVVWNAILAVLTPVFLPFAFNWDPSLTRPSRQGPVHPAVVAVVLITVFWLLDIVVLMILFYHGRLCTRLSISSDRLTIEHDTLFGVRRHERSAARITRIHAFHYMGNGWLSIESTGQWPLSLFRNRHHAEIAWLAELIKDRMTLTESKP